MKQVIVLVCLVMFGCAVAAPSTTPAGAQACRSDWDCPANCVCGFASVGQSPTCLYRAGSDHYLP